MAGKPEVIQKPRSGKVRGRGADALGTGCPKTSLLRRLQVTDSVRPKLPVLDAHKELFLGSSQLPQALHATKSCIKPNLLAQPGRGEDDPPAQSDETIDRQTF